MSRLGYTPHQRSSPHLATVLPQASSSSSTLGSQNAVTFDATSNDRRLGSKSETPLLSLEPDDFARNRAASLLPVPGMAGTSLWESLMSLPNPTALSPNRLISSMVDGAGAGASGGKNRPMVDGSGPNYDTISSPGLGTLHAPPMSQSGARSSTVSPPPWPSVKQRSDSIHTQSSEADVDSTMPIMSSLALPDGWSDRGGQPQHSQYSHPQQYAPQHLQTQAGSSQNRWTEPSDRAKRRYHHMSDGLQMPDGIQGHSQSHHSAHMDGHHQADGHHQLDGHHQPNEHRQSDGHSQPDGHHHLDGHHQRPSTPASTTSISMRDPWNVSSWSVNGGQPSQ